jgi:hypothetical protein
MRLSMGKPGNGAEALVEIINLCEQTLTALEGDYERGVRVEESDQNCRQEPPRSTKLVRRLFLIKGGLSRTKPHLSVR